jgi:hypothetical protein
MFVRLREKIQTVALRQLQRYLDRFTDDLHIILMACLDDNLCVRTGCGVRRQGLHLPQTEYQTENECEILPHGDLAYLF